MCAETESVCWAPGFSHLESLPLLHICLAHGGRNKAHWSVPVREGPALSPPLSQVILLLIRHRLNFSLFSLFLLILLFLVARGRVQEGVVSACNDVRDRFLLTVQSQSQYDGITRHTFHIKVERTHTSNHK